MNSTKHGSGVDLPDQRNVTAREDKVLREAVKRSSKLIDPGQLAAGVGVAPASVPDQPYPTGPVGGPVIIDEANKKPPG